MEEHDEEIEINHRQSLEVQKEELKRRRRIRTKINRTYLSIGIIFLIGSPIFALIYTNIYFLLFGILYGVPFIVIPTTRPASIIENEIRDIENEIDLLEISDTSIEQRAEKLFKNHQFEIKKYYDQTLRHSSLIFIVGIVCIFLGFIIIGATIYIVGYNPFQQEFQEKIVSAILGAIGGILSNFIAVIYLQMHSKAIISLTEFHDRLVVTHHLHFGNFLTSKITNETLREKTLSEIASALAKN